MALSTADLPVYCRWEIHHLVGQAGTFYKVVIYRPNDPRLVGAHARRETLDAALQDALAEWTATYGDRRDPK